MSEKSNFKQTEIGLIPEDWTVCNLAEHIEIIGGGTPKTTIKEYWNGEIPWISVVDFVGDQRWIYETEKHITKKGLENSSTKLLHKGQLIISARGTVGELGQVTRDMAFNQSCYGIDGKRDLDNDYLYYLLKQKVKELQQKGHGAVFNTITKKTFNEILVAIPTLIEQQAIARILSELDSKISLNKQINKTLEAIGQEILKRWFVDFEFPNEEGKPYKSSGGEMVHNEELGIAIPKGWKVVVITEVAEVIDCLHSKKPLRTETGPTLLQVFNIGQDDSLDLSDHYNVSEEDYKFWTRNIEVKDGDCVITNAGRVGAVAQIPEGFHFGIGRNMTAIRPIRIPPTYLINYLTSKYGINEIQNNVDTGTILDSLNVKGIIKMRVLLPPKTILDQYETLARPFRKHIEIDINQRLTLSEIRDSLLPKLMSGRIRIPIKKETSEAQE